MDSVDCSPDRGLLASPPEPNVADADRRYQLRVDFAERHATLLDLLQQLATTNPAVLKRYDHKPKRLSSRKLYLLQGLPGVGPALANRLLLQFGSVEGVMTAAESMLVQVPGIGPQKARQIRKLVSVD